LLSQSGDFFILYEKLKRKSLCGRNKKEPWQKIAKAQ